MTKEATSKKKDRTLLVAETNTYLSLGTVAMLAFGIWYASQIDARTEQNTKEVTANKIEIKKHENMFLKEQKEQTKTQVKIEKRLSTLETNINTLIRLQERM